MRGLNIGPAGEPVTNITIRMNVSPNDRIITPINSDFIGTDIARTADIPTKTSQLTNNSNFVTSDSLATVATSGSYNDLIDKPTITTVSGVNDGTNWTSLTIGSDTYGLGGGGSSYTFTDGLTETDGTVTNDLYKAIRVPNSRGNVVIGKNDSYENLDKMADVFSSNGCLVVGYVSRNNWVGYPSIVSDMSKGSIVFGSATGISGDQSYCGIKASSSSGVIAGGYTSGGHESGLINVYGRGCVGVGIGDTTTGRFRISHFATSALGRSLQSTAEDQFLIGRCNDKTNTSTMAFIIGNGTDDTNRSNALTVDKSGNLVAAGTVTPTGADYAEYFEFEDGNPTKEDRIGYLVELINGKIRLANGTDILGAISGSKGVIGDAEEMNWHGKYERDEFGRYIYEDVPVINGKGTEDEYTEVIHTKKISANYDPNKAYTPRCDRPEWAPVGLLGKVLVRHDGTLSAGDYVKAVNGIASKSDEKSNVRVLEVISDNVIKVLIK